MRRYEFMFIVDPGLPEEEIDQLNTQVQGWITETGGQVESIEKMGRRKLAYEVDRYSEGFYVLFTITGGGDTVREVERRFRVIDSVLRYITVRTDEDEKKLEKMREARQRKADRRGVTQPAAAGAASMAALEQPTAD